MNGQADPVGTIPGMKGYVNPQLVVAPRALAAELEGSETSRPLVLDLRPAEDYTAGHVPGAIHSTSGASA